MPEEIRLNSEFLVLALILFTPVAAHNYVDGSSGLKRGVHVQGNRVSYGNFAVDKFHRLQVSVGSSSVVSNYRECALSCVNNPPCSSFNVGSSPRSDGKFRCELLNEDKYTANPGQLVSSSSYHHYSIKTPCSSWPCKNGAKCIPNYEHGGYSCNCHPGYTGKTCQTVSAAEYPKTCAGVLQKNPSAMTGYHKVDPDGVGGMSPFFVFCRIESGTAKTEFLHDTPNEGAVDGYEGPGTFIRKVSYVNSLSQIEKVMSVSTHCKQYIRYDCSKSMLMANYDGLGGPYGWWVSRDGQNMYYWGGADPGSYSCGCYKEENCYKYSKYKCNCDSNNLGWRFDAGYLTDRSTLPVTELRFWRYGK
ncbi:Contactin-associated protein-like 2 [Desmophyllum pertusum]|uniref:Contactin-associated protein-like 2 n=1 Tax=Desmophyllum pertusum TaxID=174260 RepID=A0A9W9Z7F3_9CNID|nr:Contactin-associated protein-like 2 [Desmophyllum pertusum]